MTSLDIAASAKSNLAPPYWVMEKVEEAKAKGYGFCLIYVEPENHENLCAELNKFDLAPLNIRVFPARSPDFVRLADGATDHMPVMLKWADPIVIERDAPAAKKAKASKKAKAAAPAGDEDASEKAGAKKGAKKSAAKKAKKAA